MLANYNIITEVEEKNSTPYPKDAMTNSNE
jgi:hypothetical protein